ncbi:hypothetical protein [Microlunatus sp. Y2014]|uniref:hypothetical protein n=1 Tax=Microlunatus sp. Y2014 TaxID=3418488 RepID=UPI003DA75D65
MDTFAVDGLATPLQWLTDQPTIRIDRPPDWVVEVRGTAESVWWDLSGTTRRAPN